MSSKDVAINNIVSEFKSRPRVTRPCLSPSKSPGDSLLWSSLPGPRESDGKRNNNNMSDGKIGLQMKWVWAIGESNGIGGTNKIIEKFSR